MSDAESTLEVPDEAVEESRDRVQQLREELAQVNGKLVSNETSRNNAVRKARLDREAESLERQLEQARRRLEVSESQSSIVEAVNEGEAQAEGPAPATTRNQANVVSNTGEVNPGEVERLTSNDSEDSSDEEKE